MNRADIQHLSRADGTNKLRAHTKSRTRCSQKSQELFGTCSSIGAYPGVELGRAVYSPGSPSSSVTTTSVVTIVSETVPARPTLARAPCVLEVLSSDGASSAFYERGEWELISMFRVRVRVEVGRRLRRGGSELADLPQVCCML